MIHTKTEHIPATTRERETHRTCDLCGTRIKERGQGEFDECTIERRVGASYGGEGNHEETDCDMCGDCFETKLVPWLEAQGVTMRKRDVDY